jgi:hypothetical protein
MPVILSKAKDLYEQRVAVCQRDPSFRLRFIQDDENKMALLSG